MVRLTADYIVKCNGHTKRQKDEPTTRYLKRLTHLYMAERNIEAIDNLSACRNLAVLYLYDNKLDRTLNLGTAQTLTHLYLQNNNITKIEGIGHLYRLTKLYIGYNDISVVEGLQNLTQLSELHIEHQRIPVGEKLLFEPRTLVGISKSLNVLNVSGNHMDTIGELSLLKELICLFANDNLLNDFDDISHALSVWKQLQKLELTGNPICHKSKYRDNIVVASQSLELLDGKQINKLERKFLMSWKASKEARRRMRLESRLMSNGNLPPLQGKSHPPAPPHYTIGGLPGGRKRFEAILAKSRSLPASAMPVKGGETQHKTSSSANAASHNGFTPTMGKKSVSDMSNLKSGRQMTPHPNATRKSRNISRNAVLNDNINGSAHDSHTTNGVNIDLGGLPASATPSGLKGSVSSQLNQRRLVQRSGLNGYMSRPARSEQNVHDESFSTQGFTPFKKPEFPLKDDVRFPSEGASKPAKPTITKTRNGLNTENPLSQYSPLAPMPSPRLEGGEGISKVNGTSPRPIAVSP